MFTVLTNNFFLLLMVFSMGLFSSSAQADLYGYKDANGRIIISAKPRQVPQGYTLYKVVKSSKEKPVAKKAKNKIANRKSRRSKSLQNKKSNAKRSARNRLGKEEYCRTLKYEKLIHEEIVINDEMIIPNKETEVEVANLNDDDLLNMEESSILAHMTGDKIRFKPYKTMLTRAVPVEETICSKSPYMMALIEKYKRTGGRLYWGRYNDLIMAASKEHGVDSALIRAVIHTESHFKPRVVSRAGASGLMQLMPFTAKRFGVTDIFDPAQNIDGGTRYLKWLLKHFNGDIRLVTAGYNAGENAVKRYKGVPPYKETKHYVKKVQRLMVRYDKNEVI